MLLHTFLQKAFINSFWYVFGIAQFFSDIIVLQIHRRHHFSTRTHGTYTSGLDLSFLLDISSILIVCLSYTKLLLALPTWSLCFFFLDSEYIRFLFNISETNEFCSTNWHISLIANLWWTDNGWQFHWCFLNALKSTIIICHFIIPNT